MGSAQTTLAAATSAQNGALAGEVCPNEVNAMQRDDDVWSSYTAESMSSVAVSACDALVHCVRASRENVGKARTLIQQQQQHSGQLSNEELCAWVETIPRITVTVPRDATVKDVIVRVSRQMRDTDSGESSRVQERTSACIQLFALSSALEAEQEFRGSSIHRNFVTLTHDLCLGKLLQMQTVGLRSLPVNSEDALDERQVSQSASRPNTKAPSIVLFYENEVRFGMGILELDCLLILVSLCTSCCFLCAGNAIADHRQQKYQQQYQNQQACANAQYYNGQQPMYYAPNANANGVPNNYGSPVNTQYTQIPSGPVMGVPTKAAQTSSEPFSAL